MAHASNSNDWHTHTAVLHYGVKGHAICFKLGKNKLCLHAKCGAMATRDEVYAKFGITAEAAQLFETELGTLLLFAHGVQSDWHVAPDREAARATLREIDRSTLGRLLNRLKTYVELDDDIEGRFTTALEARNRLNHGFYEKHNFKIQTEEGRDAMLADLGSLHDVLFDAWQVASAMSSLAMQTLQSGPANSEA